MNKEMNKTGRQASDWQTGSHIKRHLGRWAGRQVGNEASGHLGRQVVRQLGC